MNSTFWNLLNLKSKILIYCNWVIFFIIRSITFIDAYYRCHRCCTCHRRQLSRTILHAAENVTNRAISQELKYSVYNTVYYTLYSYFRCVIRACYHHSYTLYCSVFTPWDDVVHARSTISLRQICVI